MITKDFVDSIIFIMINYPFGNFKVTLRKLLRIKIEDSDVFFYQWYG